MKFILFVTLLFLTFGLSALGIITAYRLKRNSSIAFASSLFYWSTFMVAFGYYGIWGVVFFRYLALSSDNTSLFIQNFIDVIPAFGSPLLLVSWFLLIRFSFEYANRKFPRLLTILYFAIALPLLIIFLNSIRIRLPEEDFNLNGLYKVVLMTHLLFILGSSALLISKQSVKINSSPPFLLIFSTIIPATLLFISFIYSHSHWLFMPIFIFSYFLSPAFLPAIIYFKIGDFELRKEKNNGFEVFCDRFEISKREAEIVEQICKGKTNKEIAELLFISLQTVKDHASRIYLKTEVSNRVQLSNLVRNYLKSSTDFPQT